MKLEFDDENIIIILKEQEITKIDFSDAEKVEEYFKELLSKLKTNFNINIKGFYNIYVYVDKNEGIVLKLERENNDYYDSFHQIEMRVIQEDVTFLYEVDDILNLPYKDLDIYVYKNRFYIRKTTKNKLYDIYEFGKIIFEDTKQIMENGKKMTIL